MAILAEIVGQHATQAANLYSLRSRLTHAPHIDLRHLMRFDDRLDAHFDGLDVAGEHAWPLCEAELAMSAPGALFTAAVRVIEDGNQSRLERMFNLAAAAPALCCEFVAAFGWTERSRLQGLVMKLLQSTDPFRRSVGLRACAVHRVDPGITAGRRFDDSDPEVRARAWRTAGEIGRAELVSTAAASIADEPPASQFWAAWAAVLLGDRRSALEFLSRVAAVPGSLQARAFQLSLQTRSPRSAHEWLASIAADPTNLRWLIRGAGVVGDPAYLTWLTRHMADAKTARLAGEAFSLITGADLTALNLTRRRPENFESGPNDDPNDPNVDMDEDDGLPWPDAAKIEGWWRANSERFEAGARYFMGEPLNRNNCLRVLKEGFQRQRIAAALYLSLLNPGTPLFEWRAPARRQQRLLAGMS
jgi:uncharacterized protein (TIGR02270 family)